MGRFFILLASYFSYLFFAGLFLRILNTRVWKRGSKKATAILGIIFLIIPGVAGYMFLSSPDTVDYSKEFTYNFSIINKGSQDLEKADKLHTMMKTIGMQDPTGFIFQTPPTLKNKDFKTRILDTSPYFLAQVGDGMKQTLLMVPRDWLDNKDELLLKVRSFLAVPIQNSSRLAFYTNAYNDLANGDIVEVIIDVRDSEGDGMVKIILQYERNSGFAVVNVVYTTTAYDRDKVSKVYAEAIYAAPRNNFKALSVIVLMFTSILLVMWIIWIVAIGDGRGDNTSARLIFGDSLNKEEKEEIVYSNGTWKMR